MNTKFTLSINTRADIFQGRARVIAAAPELLEAVKDLLDIIHDDLTHARQEDHKEALSAARAAIAKASDQQ